MRKYWHVINLGIQNTLVYRFNFLVRSCLTLVPLTATMYIWQAIYNHKGAEVCGYSLAQMLSYYVLVMIVDSLTAVTDDDWQIAADIRDGNINHFLTKPIDYLFYRLCLFFSGRLVYSAVAMIPTALFVAYHYREFYLPAQPLTLAWFALSLILTALIQFLLSYSMALLAFWVLEVSTFIFIVFAFENLAGGHLFPLDILPTLLAKAILLTPFPYLTFFPVSVYLERATGTALFNGLMMQVLWVMALYGVARLVWRQGIRKYVAAGG